MTGIELVSSILEIITSGFVEVGTQMGAGIGAMVNGLIYDTTGDTQTLSAFAVVALALIAVSLALSLFRWVLNFFTSMGQRNR